MDKEELTDGVYLIFQKPFNKVSHEKLLWKIKVILKGQHFGKDEVFSSNNKQSRHELVFSLIGKM